MANRALASVLVTAAILAAGSVLPRVALALTLETPMTNPDGSPNFADDQNPKYDRFRNNLSGQSGDSTDGQHGMTFGTPGSGPTFSFQVGPTQRTSNPFGFNNDRYFRLGPPPNNNR